MIKEFDWAKNGKDSIWTEELIFGIHYVAYDEGKLWRVYRHQFLSEASPDEIAFGDKDFVLKAAYDDFSSAIKGVLNESP